MGEWDYTEETVIGHIVSARIEEKSELGKQLDEFAEKNGIKRDTSPLVKIQVGDVDWEGTQSVRVRLCTLRKIVEALEEQEEE